MGRGGGGRVLVGEMAPMCHCESSIHLVSRINVLCLAPGEGFLFCQFGEGNGVWFLG